MEINKICITLALSQFSLLPNYAYATLASDATLDFSDGQYMCVITGTYPVCQYSWSTVKTGSYFAIDTSGDNTIQIIEKYAMESAGTGLTLGTAQGIGDIDTTWVFGGVGGFHYTSNSLVVDSVAGNTASIDMSGWTIFWNNESINMGQGTNGSDYFATVTCAADCSEGDSFVLDYNAVFPGGALNGLYYELHLEGLIASSVPVPAAAWLFSSGLVAMLVSARCRKKS